MKNCNCNTEIIRDGSGQLQRYLKALDPAYAPIDGRSTEDLLVFAKRYAAQIRFYDIPESKIDDNIPAPKVSWREFFRRDMAVIAASIAVTVAESFKKEYDEVNQRLQYNTTPEVYAALYAPIVGMLKKIDKWYTIAIPDNPLYTDLKLAIESDLKMQVQKIMAYEEGFKFVDPSVDLQIDLDNLENKDAWGVNETVPPDPGIYKGTSLQEKILSASLFTEDIFHAFYNFLNKLITGSEKYLQFALEQYPAHQPHMALFITFLQLFSKAQQQMNGLTGRLLDFYYMEVLQLQTKPSVPDKVHIVFELAKDVTEHKIIVGTALKAGADVSGIEQLYKSTDDLVVNQAIVKELKTIFVEKIQKGADTAAFETINTIYARPVANSSDGFGEKFPDTDTKWPTFGVGNSSKTKPKNTCEKIELLKEESKQKGQARIGFAIASPQVLMQGGKRLIQIRLNNTAAALFAKQEEITEKDNTNVFEIWFTGDKEWFKVDKVMSAADQVRFKKFLTQGVFNPLTDDIGASYYLAVEPVEENKEKSYVLSVYLTPSAQAVIEYSSKLHTAYNYNTAQAVMQVMINPLIDLKEQEYKKLSVNSLSLHVKVGSVFPNNEDNRSPQEIFKVQGITNEEANVFLNFPADGLNKLVLQNDLGLLPPGKPFDPFTAYPNQGKSFYIGSNEVFNKPMGKLAVTLKKTIDTKYMTGSSATARGTGVYDVSILESRKWIDLSTEKGNDFFQESLKSNILNRAIPSHDNTPSEVKPHSHPRKPILPVTEWSTNTEKGFIRITNLISVKSDNFLQASQNLAHTLEIKEVSVSYESDLSQLEVGVDEFYHVYPFGTIETYIGASQLQNVRDGIVNLENRKSASPGENSFAKADKHKDYQLVNAGNLLPQFTYLGIYEKYKDITNQTPYKKGDIAGELNRRITIKKRLNAIEDKLILAASGWTDKVTGGANQYSADIQEEGMLFIGLEKAKPLQMVSMLFQFAEGSAADEDNDPPEIHWSYLTNNEWRPIKEENIVSDGTVGFQTTGIIKIEIPQDATSNNTIITSGLYWLCASVTTNSNRIPMLIDIVTQAVLANFEDNNNDQSHFDKVLAAGNISKLSVAVAEVGKVQQPFASFDGKHKEIGKEFYARVSERLRHKARAITAWDYEHLVLNRFPSVYKVKCLTHTDPNCLCREPEKKTAALPPAPPPPVEAITCGIGKVDLKFVEGKMSFDTDESEKKLREVISKMNAGIKCKIIITGFFTKDDARSVVLNNKRADAVVNFLISSGIEKSRIETDFLDSGEQNMIILSEGKNELNVLNELSILNDMVVLYDKNEVCCGPQIAPGHVLLVPISNLKNRNSINPLQPKTSRRILLDIEAYIQKRTSPFVRVHAKNPVYEQVLVFFRVKFREGYDKGFHMKKLNDEIVHYLTPWAFDDIIEVKFGQKIYASSIINFIEERIYVDFITDFLMIVCRRGCCDDIVKTVNESDDDEDVLNKISNCNDMEVLLQDEAEFPGDIVAKPSTPRSILVSAPRHIIIPYQAPETLSPCEKLELKKGGIDVLFKNENIKKQPLKTGDRVAALKASNAVKERKVAEIKRLHTAEVKPMPKTIVDEKTEAEQPVPVVNTEKEIISAPVVMDSVKDTDSSPVKKPAAKKHQVKKTINKNEKPPGKK